jgi:hypothetical protein
MTSVAGEIGDGWRYIIWTTLMASGMVWVADTFARFLGGVSVGGVVGILVAPYETGGGPLEVAASHSGIGREHHGWMLGI